MRLHWSPASTKDCEEFAAPSPPLAPPSQPGRRRFVFQEDTLSPHGLQRNPYFNLSRTAAMLAGLQPMARIDGVDAGPLETNCYLALHLVDKMHARLKRFRRASTRSKNQETRSGTMWPSRRERDDTQGDDNG